MANIPTPHITAKEGDFARTVLMPGDPLRSKFIAENFLEDARLVNNVRGVQGYTGFYAGKRVSVMASGMGMPSIGIYSYELFNFYGVENIIRIGSAGMLSEKLNDYALLTKAMQAAEKFGQHMVPGAIYSSDCFYDESQPLGKLKNLGVLAVEMEAAALYMNAARAGKSALAICTISDNPFTGEGLSAEERQNSFTGMMKIALEIA